jgi:DNA invertase Pin-like site-specific DNA recombinase
LVVWRLDRLARSLAHLIATVTRLAEQGIAFRSVTENIGTSSATGQLVFHIFSVLAESERNLIKERTIAGLAAARARGKSGGRPKRSPKASKVTLAKKLYADKANTVDDTPCVRQVAAWIGSSILGALEDTHGSLRTTVQRRGGGLLAATRERLA